MEMTSHLVDFFIIQAAITIAVHRPKHRDNAAVKLGFVDHATAVEVLLFGYELAALVRRVVHIGIGKSGDDACRHRKTGTGQNEEITLFHWLMFLRYFCNPSAKS